MATTNPDKLYSPDASSPVSSLQTHLATMASSVQDALTPDSTSDAGGYMGGSLIRKVTNATTRDSLYGPTGTYGPPVQGQQVFRNDTGMVETWYDAYNSSTNPAGKGTGAGWYESAGSVRHQEWTTSLVMANASPISNLGTLTLDTAKSNAGSLITYNSSNGIFTVSEAGIYSISLRSTTISGGAVSNGRTFGLLATPSVGGGGENLDFKTIVNGDNIFFTLSTPNFKITAATDFQFQLYQTSTASRTVPLRIAVTKIA
jgi:hypothetical protein